MEDRERNEGRAVLGPLAHKLSPVLAVVGGFGAGALPFSNLVARALRGVDLRQVGTGTVSGTGLFEVAGAGPLVVTGLFEVAKGAAGAALGRRHGPGVAALAAAAAVAGHNWSPLLKGAGGRGISPALGALLVAAPAGTGLLLAGLVAGKAAGETAVGCLVAYGLLVPVCRHYHGRPGAYAAGAVLVPLLAKRLMGNAPPQGDRARAYLCRLLFDRDTLAKPPRLPASGGHRPTGTEEGPGGAGPGPGGAVPGPAEQGPAERAALAQGGAGGREAVS